jgi:membrane-associated HD superfamily phosphohydrolase
MMADAIEARSRTLKDLTEKSISDMVDQMIDTQVADGQFSETVLSFKDLEDIRTVFKQKLIEINHHRISYPAIEDNK